MTNSSLPPEILDCIIDLLHGEPETLKQCCLVSKSWVPRTRRHLFADIKFRSASDLHSWKKAFPDVANSPAYHTHTLLVSPWLVTALGGEEGGWIRAFSGVASLDMDSGESSFIASNLPLVPFYKISPSLKSLRLCRVSLPFPQLFDLILSFPLLEDLTLEGRDSVLWLDDGVPRGSQTVVLPTSPVFTGSLNFHVLEGAGGVARRLLDLPNGVHFRKLALSWGQEEDIVWITELVMRCSRTLESLDITYTGCLELGPASFDLSKATKLRDVIFRLDESEAVGWITMALQSITPEYRDLRQISIYLPYHLTLFSTGANMRRFLGEAAARSWFDLDHLLVQFWESFSIRPGVGCDWRGEEEQNTEYAIECLLPEMTKRGIVDPV